MSVSLAMTTCTSLIATKVNAATFTVLPVDPLQINPGDPIEFILVLNPAQYGSNGVQILNIFDPIYDVNELFFNPAQSTRERPGTLVTNTTIIARFSFNAFQPVKDGIGDIDARVNYQHSLGTTQAYITGNLDVQPVPEPVTIFGTATGLGCGALFKPKFSKKKS
jgi:hypothetical protein